MLVEDDGLAYQWVHVSEVEDDQCDVVVESPEKDHGLALEAWVVPLEGAGWEQVSW